MTISTSDSVDRMQYVGWSVIQHQSYLNLALRRACLSAESTSSSFLVSSHRSQEGFVRLQADIGFNFLTRRTALQSIYHTRPFFNHSSMSLLYTLYQHNRYRQHDRNRKSLYSVHPSALRTRRLHRPTTRRLVRGQRARTLGRTLEIIQGAGNRLDASGGAS